MKTLFTKNPMTRKQKIMEMLAEEPNDPELHYMLAMEHASEGDDEGAVRCFQKIFTVAPEYPAGYHQGARAMIRLGRIEEARALLERGIPIALKKGDQHGAGEMQELLASLE